MLDSEENNRISTVGLLARSPEGHAAKGMQIKGNEDLWIEIQAHTFRNWVNEHLRPLGLSVNDLATDLCDGTCLLSLVEALQKRTLRKIHKPQNQHQMLENVTRALDAVSSDGVKLVNIGNVDIVNGNLKLILGLIWSLIVRYQIGRSKFPPKKLMLAWLRSVLPENDIQNLTGDWRSGKNLSALVDYCRPGLLPHWRGLDEGSEEARERNCRVAMDLAKKELGVPIVLDPGYLASPHLDELSGMTYLSYFMKEAGPGYRTTLDWVRNQLPQRHVSNFTSDWNNGELLCELVRSLGGPVPGLDGMSTEQSHWESNIAMGMKGGEKLGVSSLLRPKDMADPLVDHLGVMAYVSQYQWLPKRPPPGQRVSVTWETYIFRKGEPIAFTVECLEEEVHHREILVEVKGPSGKVDCRVNHLSPDGRGKGSFTATEIGIHEVVVKYQGEPVVGSPLKCRVVPKLSEITYTGLSPCAVGSTVEVLVNPQDTSSPSGGANLEYMEVIALSPSGNSLPCEVTRAEGGSGFAAMFKPDEPGEWRVTVLYKGKDIQGSPFPCFVYDPNGVILDTLEGALPGLPFAFICDSRGTGGLGEVDIDITHEGRSIPYNTEYIADCVKRILLPVLAGGKHRVHIYFNGREVRGSPFSLRVGSSRSRRSKGSGHHHGKTRSFDTDNYASYSKHLSSGGGSQSFDNTYSSSSLTRDVFQQSQSHHQSLDATDAVHHRLKKPTAKSPSPSRDILSNKLYNNNNNSRETTPLKSLADSTRVHHQNASAKSSIFHYEENHKSSNNNNSSYTNGYKNGGVLHGDLVVDGDGLGVVLIHTLATVSITSEFGQTRLENVKVDVTGPSGKIPSQTLESPSGTSVSAKYTPLEVGEHLIHVTVGSRSRPIVGSPFRSAVFNPKAIKATRVPNGVVGRPVEIDIDGRGAGPGHLAILVDGGRVTSQVRALGDHRFRAVFVPHEPGPHAVDMTFNGHNVSGSPWRVQVYERESSLLKDTPSSANNMTLGEPSSSSSDMLIRGDSVKHVRFGKNAVFELAAPGFSREAVDVSVLSPSRKPLSYRLLEEGPGAFLLEFTPSEVGSHFVDIVVAGRRLSAVAKVYNSSLIKVLDVAPGVVGQTVQFKVDAKDAGEGQLEISINDGELPNQVRVLGGGACLVSFTPEVAKVHAIDIKFNGETIPGCPISVAVGDTRQVAVSFSGLELIPVHQVSRFHISVDGSSSAELAVGVKGPSGADLPVKVSGSVRTGFSAEFTPLEVGVHGVSVVHNGAPAPGTPFSAKAYDARRVYVSPVPRGALGRGIQFTVDASAAGEGNLEITIGARGRNVPTQVHPQGGARFNVSFVPLEPVDHTVTVTFNKEPVPGSPFVATVSADPGQVVVSGPSLSASPVGKTAAFTLNNVHTALDDVEVSVEGPGGVNVTTQILDKGKNAYGVEFTPRTPGEHRITTLIKGVPVPGSPFSCKVYDVAAIRVTNTEKGIVGKPVTFLVETSKAGPGNLEVTVNGGSVPTSAQAQGSHTYAISFTPKEAKAHLIELRFNSEDVPRSPFTCSVVDASKVVLKGDGLEKVPVGRRATFSIEPEAQIGIPEVRITGPAKQTLHSSIQTPSDNKFLVEYVPSEVGDHTIDVSVGSGPVPGSPFLVKAYDASKVKVSDIATPGARNKPVYFSIDASGGGAGNLEIIVSVGGRNVPNYVQAEGNAKFRVNFRPQEAAPHSISVRFNGESVPGSPFACKVTDMEKATVSGGALKAAPVNSPASLTIDPMGADVSACTVLVLSPSGVHLPINLAGALPAKLVAGFTPTEVGPHSISVALDGEPVVGSPFSCNVYDVSKVRVSGLSDGVVGNAMTFTVDASSAGEGTLELVVTTGKASLRAEVSARSRGLYDVTFVPSEGIPHYVNVTFNDVDVPGSPYECAIEEASGGFGMPMMNDLLESLEDSSLLTHGIVSTVGLDAVIAGSTAFIDLQKGHEGLRVGVASPDGASAVKVKTRTLASGVLRAEFTPDRVGTYEVTLVENNKPVSLPHPLRAVVFDPLLVRVRDKKETVPLGQETSFIVETGRCGTLEAPSIIIQSLEDVPATLKDLGGGAYSVSFTPSLPLPHRVHVLMHGYNAKGCPFEVGVSEDTSSIASGSGLYSARAGSSAGFTILTKGSSGRDFDVVVSGPGGVAVPVRCYQQRDGNLRAEFSPGSPGGHEVAVYHRSKMVKGSPFNCAVYDPQKVLLGAIPTSLTVGQTATLPLDFGDAGEALLEADVTGPEGLPKPLFSKDLKFTPRRPGKYKVALTYGGEPVPGSPLVLIAEEAGAAKAEGPGLLYAHVGKTATFSIFGPGLPGTPSVTVEGPDSVSRCDIKKVASSGAFQASYVPSEVGVFDIRVSWAGGEVPGSPYHPRVVDTSKLRIIGGWEAYASDQVISLGVGEEKKIAFNTADAGPGTLEVKLDPEAESLCRVEANAAARSKVILAPRKPGEYKLCLRWGNFEVEGTPKRISVAASAPGEYEGPVTLSGAGLVSARCGEEAYFTIDASQAGLGPAQVELHSSDVDVPVTVMPLGGGMFKGIYVPRIPGVYELSVMWGGKIVPGCPLPVQVGAIGDASKVLCTGDGLRVGTVGKDIRSFIDTRRAGPGELTAQCTGVRKTAYCELYDHGDGTFTLNIRPQESGKHGLSVKYSGEHVPGSPFALKVVGLPDASKVKVYGPGIEHGVLATFQSRFICDTRGAGAGQLTVRVRGPKGAFRVEMQRESQKDRTILCKFDPTEPGDYRVEVRWAGEHVPGSPFSVMIFDTQEELHHFLQGGSPGPGGNTTATGGGTAGGGSEFYGSTGYSMGQMSWRGSQAQL